MSSLFSTSWYRVAALRPRLRPNVEIHRQPYRGEASFVLQDLGSGKFYRFNDLAYELIGRINGQRTVDEIWQAMVEVRGDDAPTQDDVISVLGRLHAADALQGSIPPDCMELFRRSERERSKRWKKLLRSPLSLRVPLLDPDRILQALVPLVVPVLTPVGIMIWIGVVLAALVALAPHTEELWSFATTHALAPANLTVLGIIYVVVKLFHELGHGLVTRRWGGEVHEAGITFLVFIPVPYVDASASTAFRRKRKRVLVSAAGMMVELFLASIAALVWLAVEPGTVRAAAFDVMLIAGVSTLVFNGNPLLRFDAYYILEDLVEVPGLATRSTRYLTYLVQRYVLAMEHPASPVTRPGERAWFVVYGMTATVYRWVLTVTIIWFVAGQYFVVGVVLAVWAATQQLLMPIGKAVVFLIKDPRLARGRARAIATAGGFAAALVAALVLIPIPVATQADGVLLPPEDSQVKATATGIVSTVLTRPFSEVDAGQPLFTLDSPFARAKLRVLEAQLAELEARHQVARVEDRVEARALGEEILAKRAEVDEARSDLEHLVVRSPRAGRFVPLDLDDLEGRPLAEGDLIGYVVNQQAASVQVAVPQAPAGRVHEAVRTVGIRLADRPERVFRARIVRRTPAAQQELPSGVLGSAGGGSIPVAPTDAEGKTAMESVFLFELAFAEPPPSTYIGLRAHVLFAHAEESAARQLYRTGRELFLSRFGI